MINTMQMEKEIDAKRERDSNYTNDLEMIDKLALVGAISRIKTLEEEVALSRIQIDQFEKEKHDLIAVIKQQHDKFIQTRLDSLIGKLESNLSLLNELIATMKRTDYKYNLISLRSYGDDDGNFVDDEQIAVANEPNKENDGLVLVTKASKGILQKLNEPRINDDEDPIIISHRNCQEVLTVSDDDDLGRRNLKRVSRPRPAIPTIVDLDDASIQSISEKYYLLSDDSNEAPSPASKKDPQLRRTSFSNAFQKPKPTLASDDMSTYAKHDSTKKKRLQS